MVLRDLGPRVQVRGRVFSLCNNVRKSKCFTSSPSSFIVVLSAGRSSRDMSHLQPHHQENNKQGSGAFSEAFMESSQVKMYLGSTF